MSRDFDIAISLEQSITELHEGFESAKSQELLGVYIVTILKFFKKNGLVKKGVLTTNIEVTTDLILRYSEMKPEGQIFYNKYIPLQWLNLQYISSRKGSLSDFAKARDTSRYDRFVFLLHKRMEMAQEGERCSCVRNVRSSAFPTGYAQPKWLSRLIFAHCQTFVDFLQDNNLTTWKISEGPIDYDFELWTADLTERGGDFIRALGDAWYDIRNQEIENNEADWARAYSTKKLQRVLDKVIKKEKEKTAMTETPKQQPFTILERPDTGQMPENHDVTYEDMSWHLEGDWPEGLPSENAATFGGMFLAWAVLSGFASDELYGDWEEDIEQLAALELTPGAFFSVLDGVFMDEQLTEEGNAFAQHYFTGGTAQYLDDYTKILTTRLPSAYHVKDNWENFMTLKPVLDKRLAQWEAKQ